MMIHTMLKVDQRNELMIIIMDHINIMMKTMFGSTNMMRLMIMMMMLMLVVVSISSSDDIVDVYYFLHVIEHVLFFYDDPNSYYIMVHIYLYHGLISTYKLSFPLFILTFLYIDIIFYLFLVILVFSYTHTYISFF